GAMIEAQRTVEVTCASRHPSQLQIHSSIAGLLLPQGAQVGLRLAELLIFAGAWLWRAWIRHRRGCVGRCSGQRLGQPQPVLKVFAGVRQRGAQALDRVRRSSGTEFTLPFAEPEARQVVLAPLEGAGHEMGDGEEPNREEQQGCDGEGIAAQQRNAARRAARWAWLSRRRNSLTAAGTDVIRRHWCSAGDYRPTMYSSAPDGDTLFMLPHAQQVILERIHPERGVQSRSLSHAEVTPVLSCAAS